MRSRLRRTKWFAVLSHGVDVALSATLSSSGSATEGG